MWHQMKRTASRRFCLTAAVLLLVVMGGCAPEAPKPLPNDTAAPALSPAAEEPGEYPDELIARADYGPLIPYHGADTEEGTRLYGLLTLDGEVVTAPVYTVVYQSFQENEPYLAEGRTPLGFFLLSQTPRSEEGDIIGPFALAASDGSWCSTVQYQETNYLGGLLFRDREEHLICVDVNGAEQYRMKLEAPYRESLYRASWSEDMLVLSALEESTVLLVDIKADVRVELSDISPWGSYHEGLMSTVFIGQEHNFGYINRRGEIVIPPRFVRGEDFRGGFAVVTLPDGSQGIIDTVGALRLQAAAIGIQAWEDGLQYLLYENQDWQVHRVVAVYDEALRPVDSSLVGRDVHGINEGWIWYQENGQTTFVRGTQTRTIQMEGSPVCLAGDRAVFERAPESEAHGMALVTLSGTELIPYGTYSLLSFDFDFVTGLPYLRGEQMGDGDPGAERLCSILNMEGSRLASIPQGGVVSMAAGRLLFDTSDFAGLQDLDGNWLFYQPLS